MFFLSVRSFALITLPVVLAVPQPLLAGQQIPVRQQAVRQDSALVVGWTPLSKIETLLATPNALIIQDTYRVGVRTNFGMTVTAIVVSRDPSDGGRLKGLRIDLSGTSRDRIGETYLDIEEAAGLSRSLGVMMDIVTNDTRDDRRSTHVSFTTLGGFGVFLRHDARGRHVQLVSGGTDAIRTSIEMTDLGNVKSLVDDAIALLASK